MMTVVGWASAHQPGRTAQPAKKMNTEATAD